MYGVNFLMSSGKFNKNLYINGKLLTEANITTATKIERRAFRGCSSLTNVTIGNSVKNIETYAFYGCNSLISAVFDSKSWCVGDIDKSNLTLDVPSINATFLTSTYSNLSWYCNE